MNVTKVLLWKDIEISHQSVMVGISCNKSTLEELPAKIPYVLNEAFNMTSGRVVVMLADRLQAFNFQVIRGYGAERSRMEAARIGDNMVRHVTAAVAALPAKRQRRIKIARWDDMHDAAYNDRLIDLRAAMLREPQLRAAVEQVARKVLLRRAPALNPTTERIDRYCEYLIWAMPSIAAWDLTIRGTKIDGCVYPGLNIFAMYHLKELIEMFQPFIRLTESQKQHYLMVLELGADLPAEVVSC